MILLSRAGQILYCHICQQTSLCLLFFVYILENNKVEYSQNETELSGMKYAKQLF